MSEKSCCVLKKTNLATPTNSFLSVQDEYLPIALSEKCHTQKNHVKSVGAPQHIRQNTNQK